MKSRKKKKEKEYFPLHLSTSFNDIDKIQNPCYNIIITSYIKKGSIPMNHCVKLICVASLSALSLFSCSTHKERERESFPSFKDLPAVQLSLPLDVDTAEYRTDSSSSLDVELLCANTEKCSLNSSHSSTIVEEYFNLPSPTVDTSKYKTVCEGDNPPLYGGNQSSQTDNPPVVNTPIQQFSITDEEIEMLKYIVEQETRGGSYKHKCIVTNVILNRVEDSRFPNTVREVLFQKNQFSSIWNYYQKRVEPDQSTERAVNDVLNGRVEDESNGALFFHSMKSDGWFSSLSFVMEMEGHRFFK